MCGKYAHYGHDFSQNEDGRLETSVPSGRSRLKFDRGFIATANNGRVEDYSVDHCTYADEHCYFNLDKQW